jgi:hypothetical protein
VELNPFVGQFRYEAFDESGEPADRGVVIVRVAELLQRARRAIGEAP